ncbi:MAG: hypothetical protein PHQ27_02245 [Victivallales bacterium]|nr:hypothetical protein [Victivallales bacterium]
MRKGLIVGAAVIIAVCLCSCVSSERMMRVSPLNQQPVTPFDRQAINFWPGYYGHAGAGAILWPMVDWDQNGFAVRPFFLRDNHEYAVLFPLCAWNPANGDGWILPVYWDNDAYGMAPLFHVGPEFSYFGPVWRFPASGKFGFFPLYRQNNAGNGWLFPLYLYRWEDDNRLILPLFGVLGVFRQNKSDRFYYTLNWFHTDNKKNFCNDSMLPLYYYQHDGPDRLLVTPLFSRGWDHITGQNYFLNFAGPLWIDYDNGHQRYRSWLWPLYIQSSTPDTTAYGSIPFFWYKTNAKRQEEILDVMGPILFHKKNPQKSYLSIMWPFFIRSLTPDTTAYGSIPFFWYKHRKKADKTEFNLLWPLFSRNGFPALINWNDTNHNILGPLVLQHAWNYNGQEELTWDEYEMNIFFSYCYQFHNAAWMPGLDYEQQKKSSDRDNYRSVKKKQKWSFLFAAFTVTSYNTWREHRHDLAALVAALRTLKDHRTYDYISAPERREKLLRKWHKEQEQARKDMSTAWSNLKLTDAMPTTDQGFEALQQRLYERYCREVPGFHCETPLLFDLDRFGDDYKWDVLFFLARGEKENDRELTAVLEYFYRYHRNGDHSEMLLFPFITRQTAPGKTRTSFLWRLFSYETDHGNSGGYCFFIPFGITAQR